MPEGLDNEYFRKITTTVIFAILLTLSFFIVKPILISIISAIILAFIFTPVFDWIYCKVKNKDLAASIVCFVLLLLIILPMWFLTPIVIQQSIKVFVAVQQVDFVTPLKTIFPSFFASDAFSQEVGTIVQTFLSNVTNKVVNGLSSVILNFPTLALQLLVVFFTFYFVLRDKEMLVNYIKSVLPFSKEVEKKLFDYTKGITESVIYGQIIIGMIQGLIVGISLFLFGVPNALFLTILAVLMGVLPIIGPVLVWLPVSIFLLVAGNNFSAFGVIIFGIVASSVDNLIRPFIVSKRVRLHSSVILIGMIGGLFLFGLLGLILGPLILAYLLIVVEIYRSKASPAFLIPQEACKV